MATRSSVLACRIPWTEEPGGLQTMGVEELYRTGQHALHFHCGGVWITASTVIATTTIMFQTSDLLQTLTCINMNVTGS